MACEDVGRHATTQRIGIRSGPHQGQTVTLDLAADERPAAEHHIDGVRHVLDWGSSDDGIGPGWHFCPRDFD